MLTTNFVPGAPTWIDLGSRDIPASAAFYNAVFGWQFESMGPDAGGYGMLQLDGKNVGAIGGLDEGANPSWTAYFHTPDADATAKAVEQAGGTVRSEPSDVFPAGRMAHFSDPSGAQFAVWQPGEMQGFELAGVDNTLYWVELHTTDTAGAKSFYQQVFAWDYEDATMPGMTYTLITPSCGGVEAQHGGLMELFPGSSGPAGTPNWHPVFATPDCDAAFATAVGRGATVIMPPDDAPEVGRLAMLLDPAGAQFALLTPVIPATA
ncbi:VOC family protein [Streptomyces sp. H10-C2]|uniref:VOC family protein n=1 Tax=unclassified Streptomyces TaxID=2593676 RepID=UPI0024BA308A|nr:MULTISPECIES: VOC family protein [unclassified Streptomyces]MDJ0346227.1 VOC family protein [Streptomyces sp. PH10-H1]MDJ0371741.1 VOC family protein [Streptomyces sp. H10-C2]